ncbi:MAG: hypothetical protein IKQ44_11365 [Lachnospiraceae bacterium]|nr:hypothetical protein [Lachnospiraceae bacterium]
MKKETKNRILIAIMSILSLAGIVLLIMSMMNEGTHLLAIALALIVVGQIISCTALLTRNKRSDK